jgi:predicted porin
MKIFKLAAPALVLAISSTYASADVTVYGKANVSVNNIDNGSDSQWEVNSNASRVGVKGSYEVSEGLEAIYQIEVEVQIDDGDKNGQTFSQRNTYAGLKGRFGTVLVGKHDSPLKLAQGKIDRFNDQKLGDINNYMEGEDRVSNLIMYTTPSFKGITLTAALVPGENAETNEDGLADGTSISLKYTHTAFNASVSHNSDIDSQDNTRFVAETKIADLALGFLWQSAENTDGSRDEDSVLVSAQYSLGNGYAIKGQYGMTDYNNNVEDTQLALGVDKKLNKNSKVFAFYSQIETNMDTSDLDKTSFAVGYELKF